MSAPTPISAMVHSSTLVTAGIFIFFKFFYFFEEFGVFSFLLFFRIITFLLGGFLGCMEVDLKKIVAFSTIRQVRMILFFLSLKLFSLGYLHIFGHAIFKTLLFCSCGLIFLFKFRDQLSLNLSSDKNYLIILFFFVVRIYAIRGLIFSSSFYTKDLVLEIILDKNISFLFLILIIGRVLTILYSGKIFETLTFRSLTYFRHSIKIFNFLFIFFFTLLLIIGIKTFIEISFRFNKCFIDKRQIFFINIFIFMFFFFRLNFKILIILRIEILFLKKLFFREYKKPLIFRKEILNSDNFIFKLINFNIFFLFYKKNHSKF